MACMWRNQCHTGYLPDFPRGFQKVVKANDLDVLGWEDLLKREQFLHIMSQRYAKESTRVKNYIYSRAVDFTDMVIDNEYESDESDIGRRRGYVKMSLKICRDKRHY